MGLEFRRAREGRRRQSWGRNTSVPITATNSNVAKDTEKGGDFEISALLLLVPPLFPVPTDGGEEAMKKKAKDGEWLPLGATFMEEGGRAGRWVTMVGTRGPEEGVIVAPTR
ncbi:hypothetical protein B296_00034249 [Ensete ventricosum]|uniref:Uncharacterized protein n=1 Tax=Ensete ventricosum TaxID=4639 RepID=A0A426XU57_ENSVE|nr:hypothetical protein B296_00034249 [Ensete ventricosum]